MWSIVLIGFLLVQTPPPRPGSVTVIGRILFSDGAPAAGIYVTSIPIAEQQQQPRSPFARTNEMGEFRILRVAPGRYYIRAGANNEIQTYLPGTANQSEAAVVNISGDADVTNVNFSLPQSASGVRVKGHVTFPPNQRNPAGNQRVQISGIPATGVIATDGSFEIAHVRPGRYTIVVSSAPGMQPRALTIEDADLNGIELMVPRLISVEGTVAVDGSSRLPRFNLTLDSLAYRTSITALDGRFAALLPEGEYRLQITGLESGYYLKAFGAGEKDLLNESLKIKLDDSGITARMTFGVSTPVQVSGTLTSGDRGALRSVKNMLLAGRVVNEVAEGQLDAGGAFKVDRINPGAYFARVTLASGLAAPLVPVNIPAKNVDGLDIAIPGEVEIFGRISVDGGGPAPKFSLILMPSTTAATAGSGEIPTLSANDIQSLARNSAGGTQAVQLNINALSGGSFKMKLPEGRYLIAAASGANAIPPAYFVRSATYAGADLLKEPMTVSSAKPSELQIGFGTTSPNPWVQLSGQVLGFDPVKGPFTVALESRTTATIEAPVHPDGSFEFSRILQRNTYTARLQPENEAATAPVISVADKDIAGVQIIVPTEKEVRIAASVEDGGDVPGFVMTLAGSGSTVNVIGKPGRDGSFRAKVPTDERRVRISGFPLGYVVKSASFGAADLLKQPLKTGADDSSELRVAFGIDPNFPFGSVRGRVNGLDPNRGSVQLVLNDSAAFSTFETSVGPDGAFRFSRLPQGTYIPSLIGAGVSGMLSPTAIVVSGSDFFTVELTAPKSSGGANPGWTDEAPTGVIVSNLGGSREAANESSAVAQLRTINTAQVTYLSTNGGKYGTIADLIKDGLLDGRFAGTVSGFNYSVIAVGSTYAAAAIPASQGTARYGYYSMMDAVIHYVTLESLAPPGQGGRVVQ